MNHQITVDAATVLNVKDTRALAIYMVLKTLAEGEAITYPTVEEITKAAGHSSRKPVYAGLIKLKELGLIEVIPRWENNVGEVSEIQSEEFARPVSNGYVIHDWKMRVRKGLEGVA